MTYGEISGIMCRCATDNRIYRGTELGIFTSHFGGCIKERWFKMAKCEICGKGVSFGIKLSHSHRRTNRTFKPNVQRVRAIVDGTPRRVYSCTRCLRSGKVQRAVRNIPTVDVTAITPEV